MNYKETVETFQSLATPVNSVPPIPLAYPETSLRYALEKFSNNIAWLQDSIQGKSVYTDSVKQDTFAVNTVTLNNAPNYSIRPILAEVQRVDQMLECPHYLDNFEFLRKIVWGFPSSTRLLPVLVNDIDKMFLDRVGRRLNSQTDLNCPGRMIFPVHPMETVEKMVWRYSAPIALNAGFFVVFREEFAQGGVFGEPVGLLVVDGKTLVPPLFLRSTFVINGKNQPFIVKTSMADVKITILVDNNRFIELVGPNVGNLSNTDVLKFILVSSINSRSIKPEHFSGEICLYTRGYGDETIPIESPRVEITVAQNRMQKIRQYCSGKTTIPWGAYVISFPQDKFLALFGDSAILNCKVSIEVVLPKIGKVQHAISGGPLLVHGHQKMPNDVFNVQYDSPWKEEFVAGRLAPATLPLDTMNTYAPRTAIGLRTGSDTENQTVFVTIDGSVRKVHRGGVNLLQLSSYMSKIGCSEAMNLDGGGSSKLLVWGNQVNDPGDIIIESGIPVRKERPAPLALIVQPTSQ